MGFPRQWREMITVEPYQPSYRYRDYDDGYSTKGCTCPDDAARGEQTPAAPGDQKDEQASKPDR